MIQMHFGKITGQLHAACDFLAHRGPAGVKYLQSVAHPLVQRSCLSCITNFTTYVGSYNDDKHFASLQPKLQL